MKVIINQLARRVKLFMRVHWMKTIYFNYKMLPINEAIKLPIVFYNKTLFTSLKGRVVLNIKSKFNSVKIGVNDEIIRRRHENELRVDGTFTINGNFNTGVGVTICVLNNGTFEIGEGSYLGSLTKILVIRSVSIGKSFRFGYESQISDSNYHYTIDLVTKRVNRTEQPVVIGDNTWIGNRTTIMPGTKVPSNIIVASNSLLNKDYSSTVPENSVMAGLPAKLVRTNFVRIYDRETLKKVGEYFCNNLESDFFILDQDNV